MKKSSIRMNERVAIIDQKAGWISVVAGSKTKGG